ncbi:hypothetical protein, partial [Luteimonas panaciterrae]|uniref:hypothetical protein n=1 Tax=Luteimonas panaciterrae TaxID=363885 RepID=UPI001CFBC9B5
MNRAPGDRRAYFGGCTLRENDEGQVFVVAFARRPSGGWDPFGFCLCFCCCGEQRRFVRFAAEFISFDKRQKKRT